MLVTGAAGFVGRRLCVELLNRTPDARVVGSVRRGPRTDSDPCEAVVLDLSDRAAVARMIADVKPDVVFHLAGAATGSLVELYSANVGTTVNLLESLESHAPNASMVLAGSAAEYGLTVAQPAREDSQCYPLGGYAVTKYSATLAALDSARRSDLRILVARPFNIVGPGVPETYVVGALIRRSRQAIAEGASVVAAGRLDSTRDFVTLDDAVEGLLAVAERGGSGQIYNICSGIGVSIADVAETILTFAPRRLKLRVDDALLQADDVDTMVGDPTRAWTELGFEVKGSLREALWEAWAIST